MASTSTGASNTNLSCQEEATNVTGRNESEHDNIYECRACLQRFSYDAELIDLFQPWAPPWVGMRGTIAEDLAKLANVEISMTDELSKFICQVCHEKLLEACCFAASVHENDQVLRRKTNMNVHQKVWPQPIQVVRSVDNIIFEETLEIDIKQEPPSDDEMDECMRQDMEPSTEIDTANLDIKIEPEEIEQPQFRITVNGTISHDEFAQNSVMTNGNSALVEVTVKQEPNSEDEDNETVPDLPLECMLCTKSFNSVSGLKAHVIAQHSYKTVKRKTDSNPSSENGESNKYVCAICRRKFTTSTDLMVHETCHNKHSCYGCNEKFDTFALLTCHREKCKAVLGKTTQKPKTLEDVKRPHMESPKLAEIKAEAQESPQTPNDSQPTDRTDDSSSVKVHLQIQSLADKITTDHSDIEMKVEAI